VCTRLAAVKLVQFPRSRSRSTLRLIIASAWPLVCVLSSLSSLIASEPLAKGIQDNSFFIEEAYNQEPGVVQHIFNLPIDFTNGAREIAPSFTQEWLVFSQTHQFSYTIPYVFTEDDNGMEDMRLPAAGIHGRQIYAGVRAAFVACAKCKSASLHESRRITQSQCPKLAGKTMPAIFSDAAMAARNASVV
jgi:hypothetical protein